MFNNTYSPVGSPVKKNVTGGSPVSSPLKHPRTNVDSTYTPSYKSDAAALGQPVEIIQGK